MPQREDVTLDDITRQALLAGLTLPDEEAQALVAGVNRNRAMAAICRDFIEDHETTPAGIFGPLRREA
jgi:hypothetical protein